MVLGSGSALQALPAVAGGVETMRPQGGKGSCEKTASAPSDAIWAERHAREVREATGSRPGETQSGCSTSQAW
jgi:hypothetical protein